MQHWICLKTFVIWVKIAKQLESSTQTAQLTSGAIIINIWRAGLIENCKNALKSPNALTCRLKIPEWRVLLQNLRPARRIFNVLRAAMMLWESHHWSAPWSNKTHVFATNCVQSSEINASLLNGKDFAWRGAAFVGNCISNAILASLACTAKSYNQ